MHDEWQRVFGPYQTAKLIVIRQQLKPGCCAAFTISVVDFASLGVPILQKIMQDADYTVYKLPPANVLGLNIDCASVYSPGNQSEQRLVFEMQMIPTARKAFTAPLPPGLEGECEMVGCTGSFFPCDPETEDADCDAEGNVSCVPKVVKEVPKPTAKNERTDSTEDRESQSGSTDCCPSTTSDR